MTKITSISYAELNHRRHQLKQLRRLRAVQALWRSLLVCGMAGGLSWLVSQSNWVISQSSQINIEGNQILSEEAILALLPWSYPQSLLQLEPQQLTQQLESIGPIAKATVTRRLLPPSLTIEVTERQPVAIAIPIASTSATPDSSVKEAGFLDEQGIWMPKSTYTSLAKSVKLPTLRIIGSGSQYLPYWPQIYPVIRNSRVKIWEIDWRNPTNIIIKTELGRVRIGAYTSQFPKQLTVLAQMQDLSRKVSASQIDYIDLSRVDAPTVQLKND